MVVLKTTNNGDETHWQIEMSGRKGNKQQGEDMFIVYRQYFENNKVLDALY